MSMLYNEWAGLMGVAHVFEIEEDVGVCRFMEIVIKTEKVEQSSYPVSHSSLCMGAKRGFHHG